MPKTSYQNNTTSDSAMPLLLFQCGNRLGGQHALLRRQSRANFQLPGMTCRPPSRTFDQSINHILNDIRELSSEEDSDGYIFRPTESARENVWKLVVSSYIELDSDRVPRPFISPDGRGGIRVEWTVGHRVISLVCPPNPGAHIYVYHASGDDYGVNEQTSVQSLTIALRWLLND